MSRAEPDNPPSSSLRVRSFNGHGPQEELSSAGPTCRVEKVDGVSPRECRHVLTGETCFFCSAAKPDPPRAHCLCQISELIVESGMRFLVMTKATIDESSRHVP
nr:hypothetical protein CFP56_03199 [Quercus suber]